MFISLLMHEIISFVYFTYDFYSFLYEVVFFLSVLEFTSCVLRVLLYFALLCYSLGLMSYFIYF
jgi:hypothetical protein